MCIRACPESTCLRGNFASITRQHATNRHARIAHDHATNRHASIAHGKREHACFCCGGASDNHNTCWHVRIQIGVNNSLQGVCGIRIASARFRGLQMQSRSKPVDDRQLRIASSSAHNASASPGITTPCAAPADLRSRSGTARVVCHAAPYRGPRIAERGI